MEASDNLVRAFSCHLLAVQAENASVATLRLYDGRHKQFLSFLQAQGEILPFRVDLLNAANVRRAAIWVREHSTGNRGGESAAAMLVGCMKTTSAWLADEGFIDADLLSRVRRPRVTATTRQPFTQEEVRGLVDAALDTRLATRDIVVIHLLLDTGMRVGGLCSILLEDVDLRERRLELRLKGGRRHTLYFGSSERRDGGRTVRSLRAYLGDRQVIVDRWRERDRATRDGGHLLVSYDGWPLTENGVRGVFDRLAKTSGIHHVIPHRFRHTFATWYLVRNPGDETGLRGILGHLSDDMFRAYVHMAHEIIAQRAGRVALSEAWLGNEQTPTPIERLPMRSTNGDGGGGPEQRYPHATAVHAPHRGRTRSG